ncbi:MAG: isocitrate/isopropylmalate dehydrogenase family protein [Acidobacteriota bacterium]
MSALRIALLGGDGVGPEVVSAVAPLLAVLEPDVETVELAMGFGCFEREGHALPPATIEGLRSCRGALFGAVGSPSHPVSGYRSPLLEVRRTFELFANLRPLVSMPGDGTIDAVVVRENTEGLYSGRERLEGEGDEAVAVAERVVSVRATERIVRAAATLARERLEQGRNARLTIVHKANVLRTSDGLFRETALRVASDFPELQVEEQLVDSMAYRLVLEPERYGVIVASNLYGDVLSDLGAALVGGLGVVPSANVGDRFVLAEPVHGSAPDLAGRGLANPIATARALAMLLERLERPAAARTLDRAIERVLLEGPRTPDLGGSATTREVAHCLLSLVERT